MLHVLKGSSSITVLCRIDPILIEQLTIYIRAVYSYIYIYIYTSLSYISLILLTQPQLQTVLDFLLVELLKRHLPYFHCCGSTNRQACA